MLTETFAMIKPGAVQRGLIGEIIQRLEKKGLKIKGIKFLKVSEKQAKMHYAVHEGKDFYQRLIKYIGAGPVVALVLEGENAVEIVRHLSGATDPLKSEPGTIRGDLSADRLSNIIHTSDSEENAQKEIQIYFDSSEIIEYKRPTDKWTFEYFDEY